MAKYFTLNELSHSYTANEYGIANVPNEEEKANLMRLANNLLDPIREKWGKPIIVNSGFRSVELNSHPKIKGAKTSQHLKGEAADITTSNKIDNKSLFYLIHEMQLRGEIEFDQLIDESNYTWIHVSLKESNNRNEVKHL